MQSISGPRQWVTCVANALERAAVVAGVAIPARHTAEQIMISASPYLGCRGALGAPGVWLLECTRIYQLGDISACLHNRRNRAAAS
jgi:hypothetical protein